MHEGRSGGGHWTVTVQGKNNACWSYDEETQYTRSSSGGVSSLWAATSQEWITALYVRRDILPHGPHYGNHEPSPSWLQEPRLPLDQQGPLWSHDVEWALRQAEDWVDHYMEQQNIEHGEPPPGVTGDSQPSNLPPQLLYPGGKVLVLENVPKTLNLQDIANICNPSGDVGGVQSGRSPASEEFRSWTVHFKTNQQAQAACASFCNLNAEHNCAIRAYTCEDASSEPSPPRDEHEEEANRAWREMGEEARQIREEAAL